MYRRNGFTLIELLVVISIVGVLLGMLMPAVQAIRAAARRTDCLNRLRQVGLAVNSFHEAQRAYPPARFAPLPGSIEEQTMQPVSYASWFVRIMPYVEQRNIYDLWDLQRTFEEQVPEATSIPLEIFLCPERRSAESAVSEPVTIATQLPCGCNGPGKTIPGGALGDYAGNLGDLSPGATGQLSDFYQAGKGTGVLITSHVEVDQNYFPTRWTDRISQTSLTDGASNTILAGEAHKPVNELRQPPMDSPIYSGLEIASICRIGGPGVPLVRNKYDASSSVVFQWGSWHPQICNFVMADGSTQSFNHFIDTTTLGRLCHRRDGEVLDSSNAY
jgi:prepilin-type N-terminal cleavage/methylation domain-containing protein